MMILNPNDKFGKTSSLGLLLTWVRNNNVETTIKRNINARINTGPRGLELRPCFKLKIKQRCTTHAKPSVPATR